MDEHDMAAAICDKLRNIRLDVMLTAEDVLTRCGSREELEFYYDKLCPQRHKGGQNGE